MTTPIEKLIANAKCALDECDNLRHDAKAKSGYSSYCPKHRSRLYRYGTTDAPAPKYKSDEERFWSKVDKKSVDECWEWRAAKSKGYGKFFPTRRKGIQAHRYAYWLVKGEIPKGLIVRHKCDNTACCNPAHLEIGTSQDNSDDMIKRDRHRKGESVYGAKLTSEIVAEIKQLFNDTKLNNKEIGEMYGVTKCCIRKIRAGESWSHI